MPTHLVKTLQEARRRAYLGCVYRTSCGRRPICFILLCSTKWDSKPAYVGYIEGFQERSNVEVRLSLSENLERLPQDLELMIFRVVQECLTNIHRHSGSATPQFLCPTRWENLRCRFEIKAKGCPWIGWPRLQNPGQQESGYAECGSVSKDSGEKWRSFLTERAPWCEQ
jgi:hypothetical protein